MRKIIEVDTQTDKYPIVTISSGPTKDAVLLRIGKAEAVVSVDELLDAVELFRLNPDD